VALTNNLLRINTESDDYVRFIANFIRHVYENNYMVFLPTPNNAYAVNKEVVFTPGLSAFISLRDLQVTDLHWSVRGDNPYPPERKIPLNINREISAEVTQ
jgi:peptide/nickel transport system substrate-binding protein